MIMFFLTLYKVLSKVLLYCTSLLYNGGGITQVIQNNSSYFRTWCCTTFSNWIVQCLFKIVQPCTFKLLLINLDLIFLSDCTIQWQCFPNVVQGFVKGLSVLYNSVAFLYITPVTVAFPWRAWKMHVMALHIRWILGKEAVCWILQTQLQFSYAAMASLRLNLVDALPYVPTFLTRKFM